MAGIDKEFTGEAWLADGATVGYLPQEPQLDPTKDVHGQRHGGRRQEEGDPRPLQRTDDELLRRDRGRGRQAPGPHRQPEPLGPRRAGRAGDGCARLPAGRRRRRPSSPAARSAASRSASCSSRSPTFCSSTSRPTISTPRSCTGSRSISANYPGAILIVTHDRYFLDNVTGWILELDRGRGIPYEGNYSAYLEKKAKRLAQEGREEAARQRALDREREWIAASPRARQAKSKARIRPMTNCSSATRSARPAPPRSSSRRASASATTSSTSRTCRRAMATAC